MNEPVEFNAAHFFEFIGRPQLVVVFLSVHPAHPLNRALPRHLGEGDVLFGTATLLDFVMHAGPALSFLRQGLLSCGVPTPLDALPGYYAFHDGRMLAWDSGLPTRADAQTIVGGSLLGMVMFAFTRDVAILGKAFRIAADEATAARLAHRFRHAYDESRAEARPQPGPRSESEVGRAYRTLGVSPSATDHEVEIAWRELRLKFHPDLTASDPVEFERRGRLAVELNRARDLIREHRARAAG